ncbi:hypothetical protein [Carnobacterium maltaromaticum]|uniref:hypothetical protein n=1 Tax=Carnobacterium maltaromaticum TaxID=2751 RepID=UPI0039B09429
MGLLDDKAKEMLQGFDPKKDNPNNSNQYLADGEYDAMLSAVAHKVYDSGWECLEFIVEITTGESTGQKEYLRLGFGEKTPEFIKDKQFKLIAQIASTTNIVLSDDDWDDEESLSQAFQNSVGCQFIFEITSSLNKKKPNEPYRNFQCLAYEDDGEDSEVDGESP